MTGNIHDKYEGLCLAPDSFANNIHDLLCAVVVLQMSDNDAIKEQVMKFLNLHVAMLKQQLKKNYPVK